MRLIAVTKGHHQTVVQIEIGGAQYLYTTANPTTGEDSTLARWAGNVWQQIPTPGAQGTANNTII